MNLKNAREGSESYFLLNHQIWINILNVFELSRCNLQFFAYGIDGFTKIYTNNLKMIAIISTA